MKPATERDYHRRILRVLRHIQANLDRPLPLGELAAEARFSPFHFHRIFKAMVGETVAGHVRRLRLERASMRLRYSTQPVTDIAFDAGFEAAEAFSRAFKAWSGQSPSAFRAAHGAFSPPAAASGVHWHEDGGPDAFTPATGDPSMDLDVAIETLPGFAMAYLRHTGPYMEMGATFEKALGLAGRHGLFGPETLVLSLSWDDPEVTAPDKLRADAGVSIAGMDVETGDLAKQEIQGGTFAVTMFEGPYQRLAEVHNWLYGQWLPQSGWEAEDRPCVEIYRNDPSDTPPEKLLTEIRIPVVKPGG